MPPHKVIRIGMKYIDGKVGITYVKKVQMKPPKPDRQDLDRGGFRISVYDKGDNLLYQRTIGDFLDSHIEAFSEDRNKTLFRVDAKNRKEVGFEVVIPDIENGARMLITRKPLKESRAIEVASLDLASIRNM